MPLFAPEYQCIFVGILALLKRLLCPVSVQQKIQSVIPCKEAGFFSSRFLCSAWLHSRYSTLKQV